MSSMSGSTGFGGGSSTGSKLRGSAPGMKAPHGYGKFQQFTPEQLELFQQMFGQVEPDSFLSKLIGGDEETFNQIEAPALRQFSGLQGNIASRFSGMGSGSRRSSGFQNTMGAEASNFAQQLQSQRQGLQRQALMDMMGISQNLLGQQPYGLYKKPEKQSTGWGGMLGAGVGGLGGFLAGGPAGALQGAQLGYGVGSQF